MIQSAQDLLPASHSLSLPRASRELSLFPSLPSQVLAGASSLVTEALTHWLCESLSPCERISLSLSLSLCSSNTFALRLSPFLSLSVFPSFFLSRSVCTIHSASAASHAAFTLHLSPSHTKCHRTKCIFRTRLTLGRLHLRLFTVSNTCTCTERGERVKQTFLSNNVTVWGREEEKKSERWKVGKTGSARPRPRERKHLPSVHTNQY